MTTAASTRMSRGALLALGALAAALVGLTVLVSLGRPFAPAVVNDRLDVAILTASTLVAFAVAALDWARAGVTHETAAVLRSSAFTVLALYNLVILFATIAGRDAGLGLSLADPGQLPIVTSIASRGLAALLLCAAGAAVLSRRLRPPSALVMVLVPAALVLAMMGVAAMVQDRLPALVPAAVLEALASDPTASPGVGAAPVLLLIQSFIGLLFGAAAFLAYGAYRRSGRTSDVLLAGGLLMAAFSQVHGAIHAGTYAGLVTTADLLRLGFYGLLLLGVIADSTQDLADLRLATAEVRKLAADRYVAAGLEERARLAREIHDGLAQDLWYAKLKQTRLAQIVGFNGEAKQLSDEVANGIDAALAEARNAIAALREGAEAGPLVQMIERHVADFADRFALRAEFTAEGRSPELGPRAKAEVLRIVQEALTNVRKHADATIVRVSVHSDGEVRLIVVDNGRGFDVDAMPIGFGLDSMRQRAAVIGARLMVASEPQNGTRIELVVPHGGEGRVGDGG
jgi:signal transduction histidine kinase